MDKLKTMSKKTLVTIGILFIFFMIVGILSSTSEEVVIIMPEDVKDCPAGQQWVDPDYVDGKYISGYCEPVK